jgi:hypothetical protein
MLRCMRKLRILLTLLLCLTIPVAGWASVLAGFMPTHSHGHFESAKPYAHSDHLASAQSEHIHHHQQHQGDHCGKVGGNGNPCKNCKCGCGIGLCGPSSLSFSYPVPVSFKLDAGKQSFSRTSSPARAIARGSSPLRPPIS